MFEKESKEYTNKWLYHVKDLELHHKEDEKPEYIRILEAHQKGAELGYAKANEWHYPEYGDLPTHTRPVLVYLSSDDVDIDYYGKCLGWKNHLNEQIIAWKEITLPELSKKKQSVS